MAYSENCNVEDTVLTVINDGEGSQCGYTYDQRLAFGRLGDSSRWRFREIARNYSRYRHQAYESRLLTPDEWKEAGDLLLAYYQEHVKEVDKP